MIFTKTIGVNIALPYYRVSCVSGFSYIVSYMIVHALLKCMGYSIFQEGEIFIHKEFSMSIFCLSLKSLSLTTLCIGVL